MFLSLFLCCPLGCEGLGALGDYKSPLVRLMGLPLSPSPGLSSPGPRQRTLLFPQAESLCLNHDSRLKAQ